MGCRGKGSSELFKGYYGMLITGLWECVKVSMECSEEGPKDGKGRDPCSREEQAWFDFFLDQSTLAAFHYLIIPCFFQFSYFLGFKM